MLLTLAAIVLAYLLGSIPFAVVVSRLLGLQDPRTFGSGNPGATNVLRSGSKTAAILTLIGDAAKGWVAVWVALRWGVPQGLTLSGVALVALAAFLGHLYSVFLHFKGGKGVATAAGVLLALQPLLGVAVIATWLIIAVFFRYSSLAALVAAIFAPLFYAFGSGVAWAGDIRIGLAITFIGLLLIYRHRGNLERLFAGKESRIGDKKAKS